MVSLECMGRIPVHSLIVSMLLQFCYSVHAKGYATKQ